jgi:hypothetical protein
MNKIVRSAITARTVTAILIAAACPSVFGQSMDIPDIQNWRVPLFWAPPMTQPSVESARQSREVTALFTSPTGPLPLVAVTPCRLVDTRLSNSSLGFTGAFGAPQMLGGTQRSIPVPTGNCSIPGNARAYSLNVTVVPSGPLAFLTIWPTGQPLPNVSLLNSPSGGIVANNAIVIAGTSGAVSVFVTNTTDVIIDINGYFVDEIGGNGNGATGATGPAGPSGAAGAAGAMGATGERGAAGAIGATGTAGALGATGAAGALGATGAVGPIGATGAAGVIGATGTAGAPGATGALGPIGATGTAGAPGSTGTAGANGSTGATGLAGTAGGAGAAGSTGSTGATGTTGATGAAGTGSFTPAYGSFSNDTGATIAVILGGTDIPLPTTSVSAGVGISGSTATVANGGVYRVSYCVRLTASQSLSSRLAFNGSGSTASSVSQNSDKFCRSQSLYLSSGTAVSIQLFGILGSVTLVNPGGAELLIELLDVPSA